jgi:hypothetical protein
MAMHSMKGLTVASSCLVALCSLRALAAEETPPANRAAAETASKS